MGYFVIIIFTTFLGAPPEFLPIAFKKEKNCENYLTKVDVKKFTNMKVMQEHKNKYLSNLSKNKFIICKKLEYPILNTKLQRWSYSLAVILQLYFNLIIS